MENRYSENEYYLDIFEAILSVREIEGNNLLVGIAIPNPNFEFVRYKKYPYSDSYFSQLINKYHDISIATSIVTRDRIIPYLEDYIFTY